MTAKELLTGKPFDSLLEQKCIEELMRLSPEQICLTTTSATRGVVEITEQFENQIKGKFIFGALLVFELNEVVDESGPYEVSGEFSVFLPDGLASGDASTILADATLTVSVKSFPRLFWNGSTSLAQS